MAKKYSQIIMPIGRWRALMAAADPKLSENEIKAGWHFCPEWDELLIGPGMYELKCCTCEVTEKLKQSGPAESGSSN